MDLMSLMLPTTVSPLRITLEHLLTDDDLLRLCEQNEVFHVERDPDGTLLARKIAGTDSGFIGGNCWVNFGIGRSAMGVRGRIATLGSS